LVVLYSLGPVLAVGLVGAHELVGNADGVVGVLEEDRREGFGVRAGTVVAIADERVRLGFFLSLALDEVNDVGVLGVEDGHLCGATRSADPPDDAGESIESGHKAERPAGSAAAGHAFVTGTERAEVGAGAGAVLEKQ